MNLWKYVHSCVCLISAELGLKLANPVLLMNICQNLNLGVITLSEISQAQEDKHCMVPFIAETKKVHVIDVEYRVVTIRDQKKESDSISKGWLTGTHSSQTLGRKF